jgi:hypothetical protein
MTVKKERKDAKIIVLVSTREKKEIEKEAAQRGVSLAQICREKLFPK